MLQPEIIHEKIWERQPDRLLGGKNVGLEPLGNRVYRLYFRQFFLGYADMKTCKVYDIMKYNHELDV